MAVALLIVCFPVNAKSPSNYIKQLQPDKAKKHKQDQSKSTVERKNAPKATDAHYKSEVPVYAVA
jgi:hypothetical protein